MRTDVVYIGPVHESPMKARALPPVPGNFQSHTISKEWDGAGQDLIDGPKPKFLLRLTMTHIEINVMRFPDPKHKSKVSSAK